MVDMGETLWIVFGHPIVSKSDSSIKFFLANGCSTMIYILGIAFEPRDDQ